MSGAGLGGGVPVADTGSAAAEVAVGVGGADAEPPSRARRAFQQITSGGVLITVLAVLIALVAGAILIVLTNEDVQTSAGYFFSRPGDTFKAIGEAVGGAYAALFRGGVYDYNAHGFGRGIASLLNSINYATPLIAAGLGLAVGFRAGVFNIGGQGQILIAGAIGGWIGFSLHLPSVLHMIVAVLGALIGGAIWAGIVGLLKARTGAHEVIVTIMLNYIALYLVDYLLHTPVLRAPGSQNPHSPSELATAVLFPLVGSQYKQFNFGFILVIAATIFAWWLLNRSSLGFRLRAVGENPRAARVSGINVNRTIIIAMVISGVLVGLAGAYQVLGQNTGGFGSDFDSGIGVTAITVALLGRSRPWGVFAAGIAFGVLQGGGATMQAAEGVDIDIVQVIQAVIVLFIAAPPLVRAIFRLPQPGKPRRSRRRSAIVSSEGAAQ